MTSQTINRENSHSEKASQSKKKNGSVGRSVKLVFFIFTLVIFTLILARKNDPIQSNIEVYVYDSLSEVGSYQAISFSPKFKVDSSRLEFIKKSIPTDYNKNIDHLKNISLIIHTCRLRDTLMIFDVYVDKDNRVLTMVKSK